MADFAPHIGVPPTDTAANDTTGDVIGSKLDRTYNGGNSIFAEVHTLGDHFHSVALVRPDLAASVQIVAGLVAWTYGGLSADLIAVADPVFSLDAFDVHFMILDTPSANTEYQLQLIGDAADVLANIPFTRTNVQTRSFQMQVQTPVVAAGTRIRARMATAAGGGETINVKLIAHAY